ncbi:Ig-like domain-containing protein [Clostridium sp. JS66]|uniref:Ig-like domain-containing protein n=1 Tax=Clostridium sp. JS66 TaxID=3064705 RepID=UPI00298EB4D9|nr:Ig-like domain-containing protein [Clostridium sp. JS66]WPC43932.1 Ig-like domain-containing protein [Clostridium sp. JS66]
MNLKYKIIALYLTLICSLLLPNCTHAKDLRTQNNVTTDKTWSIKFNVPIDTKTLDSNINITDSKGNVLNTVFNASADNKIITVIPKRAYIPNETYTLNINQNIRSVRGKSLEKSSTKSFVVSNIYSINTENEKIIKKVRSYFYTNNELKNMKIKYLGNVEGYFIYYVPLKPVVEEGNDYTAKGYVFSARSMQRIVGIKDGELYTLGNLIFETSLREHVGEVYNLLIDEFKDLNNIPYEI